MNFPQKGIPHDEILSILESYQSEDINWREGKTFGFVFHTTEEVTKMVEDAFNMYIWHNGLDPSVYRSLFRIETEIVDMARDHLGGDTEVVGNVTSGGTESIILAVKAARDKLRDEKDITGQTEIVLPRTAHAAFHKAAHYLDMKVVVVPVNPKTYAVEVDAMEAAINANTAMIVGSAPSFSHGIMDPIEGLAQVAKRRDVWLHVDGCIGGFMLPYFRKLGADVPPFDFSIEGVSSISMDFHKYAFAAKGSSIILFRSKALRQYEIFTCSGWTGYTIINPTVQSSKSGGPMAGTWAVLKFLGHEGYLEIARQLYEGTRRYIDGINSIDTLEVLGDPKMSLICFASRKTNPFALADAMLKRGWHIQPQMKIDELEENIHLTIMPNTTDKIDAFVNDLGICVKEVADWQPDIDPKAIGEMMNNTPLEAITPDSVDQMFAMAGIAGKGLPKEMATINAVLNELDVPVANRLLRLFYNNVNVPTDA